MTDDLTPPSEQPAPVAGDATPALDDEVKVRRSIFLPQSLDAALSRLAEERGTSTTDLIRELLQQVVDQAEKPS